jgi:hypothetical protein
VSKPCIAFKILAAGRHCNSPQEIEAAFRYAFRNIKASDVVLVGIWQKHRDQASENVAIVRPVKKLDLTGGKTYSGNAATHFQPSKPFEFLSGK